MDSDTTQNTPTAKVPANDDWKSSLPGAPQTPISTSPTAQTRLPVPPIPKMGSSLNMATEVAIAKEKSLPPLDKIGLAPKPPKTPPLPPAPAVKQTIMEIPIPPAPELTEEPESLKPVPDLRTVKTFRDDALIAEGRNPETHNINYNKVSSDEDVNKFLKPRSVPVAPLPPNPVMETNFDIKTPTGVHNPIFPPKPPLQDAPMREAISPIRKTVLPEAPNPAFNPNRFGGQTERPGYDAGVMEKPSAKAGDGLSRIRTLKDDVNQVIQDKNVTLASIAIKEDERRRSISQTTISKKSNPALVISIVLFLLVGGSVAIWFAFYRDTAPATVIVDESSKTTDLIFTDTDLVVEVSTLEVGGLSSILNTETQKELRLGQMKNIRLVNTVKNSEGKVILREIPSVRILFEILDLKAEDRILRLLSNNYLVGVYSFTNKSPFLILEADDYSTIFAQILVWEGKGFAQNAYESLTGMKLEEELKGTWKDEVIENLDVRVFRDETGQALVYWAFIDRVKTLVITTDDDTLLEVRTRFQTRTVAK